MSAPFEVPTEGEIDPLKPFKPTTFKETFALRFVPLVSDCLVVQASDVLQYLWGRRSGGTPSLPGSRRQRPSRGWSAEWRAPPRWERAFTT